MRRATLAEQLGFSKQQGLNLQLLDEPAGVDATTAMLAGQVQGVGGFFDLKNGLKRLTAVADMDGGAGQ